MKRADCVVLATLASKINDDDDDPDLPTLTPLCLLSA